MNNDLTTFDRTIVELKAMVEENLQVQSTVLPIYQGLAAKILTIVDREEEISQWEPKDLLKLLDLANKAQLSPIEQLTKLTQSLANLYEKSELQKKVEDVSAVVNEMQKAKRELEEIEDADLVSLEEDSEE